MARKKVREYDAKRLLAKHLGLDIRSAQVTPDTDLDQLAKQHTWLKKERLVVKPDMLFGKRGKNNLVLLDADFEQAKGFIKKNMKKEIEISGVPGVLTHFLIEPFFPHEEEFYLSIVSDRGGDNVNFSAAGGMSVEENWDRMVHVQFPVSSIRCPVPETAHSSLETQLDGRLPQDRKLKTRDFILAAHRMFSDLDLTLLEMNPFTFDDDGNPFPLDLRMEIDDTAEFKDAVLWDGVRFPPPFGRNPYPEEKYVKELDSKSGASLKLTVLNPEGRIWTMVAGGGASVIYTDTVVDLGYGDELGNYGEYSGNPNEEETYLYSKTLLDLATRHPHPHGKVLLIGGGIANFTDVANTFKGIIHALKDYKEKLKENNFSIFVRRGGPNYETGLRLMQDLGRELGVPIEVYGPETSMTAIVPLAIKKLKR